MRAALRRSTRPPNNAQAAPHLRWRLLQLAQVLPRQGRGLPRARIRRPKDPATPARNVRQATVLRPNPRPDSAKPTASLGFPRDNVRTMPPQPDRAEGLPPACEPPL